MQIFFQSTLRLICTISRLSFFWRAVGGGSIQTLFKKVEISEIVSFLKFYGCRSQLWKGVQFWNCWHAHFSLHILALSPPPLLHTIFSIKYFVVILANWSYTKFVLFCWTMKVEDEKKKKLNYYVYQNNEPCIINLKFYIFKFLIKKNVGKFLFYLFNILLF